MRTKQVTLGAGMGANGWGINVIIDGSEFDLDGTTLASADAAREKFWGELKMAFPDNPAAPMKQRREEYRDTEGIAQKVAVLAETLASLWENAYGKEEQKAAAMQDDF